MSAQMHAQATYVRLENYTKACEIIIFFVMKQTNELNVLCSVAKHLRGGQSTQEAGRFSSMSCVFLTSFVL